MLNKSNHISLLLKAFLVLALLFGLYSVVQSDVLAECTAVGQDCSSLRCGTNCGGDSQCNFCYKYGKCATDDEGETYYCATSECVLQCQDGCPCQGPPGGEECPNAPGVPTNVSCTMNTANHTATLSWAPPSGGTTPTSYLLRILEDGYNGGNCDSLFICEDITGYSRTWNTSYTSSLGGDIFSYYDGWMYSHYKDSECDSKSDPVFWVPCTAPPTCNILSTNVNDGTLKLGTSETNTLSANLSNIANGSFNKITFTGNSTQISIAPSQRTSPEAPSTYTTTLGLGSSPTVGPKTVNIRAYADGEVNPICQDTETVTIVEADPPTCSVSAGVLGALIIDSPEVKSNLTINVSSVANFTLEGISIGTDETQVRKNPGQFSTPPPPSLYHSVLSLGTNPTPGSKLITISVYSQEQPATPTCETTANVVINDAVSSELPWWQVIGGDVITMGEILSNIPGVSGESDFLPAPSSTLDLILDSALGGLPGIAYYVGVGNITPDAGPPPSISSADWNVSERLKFYFSQYTYSYFYNLIPASIDPVDLGPTVTKNKFTSCVDEEDNVKDGYCWYETSGTINLESQNLDNRKVILFVEGSLNIDGEINFNDGEGFFMAIVRDNIIVNGDVAGDASVPALEGIYYSQGGPQGEEDIQVGFETGVSNNPLYVRGVVVTLDEIALERDLESANSTDPSESFEFAPDVILNYPRTLINRNLRWIGEVNP